MLPQVSAIWQNHHNEEQSVAGARLYPLPQTPWHFFAPEGIPRERCAVLSQEAHTVAVGSVRRRRGLVCRAVRPGAEAAVAAALQQAGEGSILCHLQTTGGGGVDNLAA